MATKKRIITDTIKELPAIMAENKEESFIPFIEKGKVFQSQTNTRWLINFDKIPELITGFFDKHICQIENWYNWKFKNSCICPEIFLRGEKIYGYS